MPKTDVSRRQLPRFLAAWAGSLLFGAALTAGCSSPPPVPYDPPPPSLRRLTQAQYANTVHDILGEGIVISGGLEPDVASADFLSVGASETSISPRGVAQYERLAYDIAHQALTGSSRALLVPCTPMAPSDASCAKQVLSTLGRKLFRRPLGDDEQAELTTLAGQAGTTLGDFYSGLEFALAALLQSDNFLFRVELGEPDPASTTGGGRFGSYALASRLAYFLWNGPPDDALLTAAAEGRLDSRDSRTAEIERMLSAPLARRGLRAFVSEQLQLYLLDDLVKDPKIYTQASLDLWPAAREETLADFERLVFDLDGDLRDILLSRDTIINRKLASIYGVRAPSLDKFALASLPADQPRRGLLGQVSVLALQAHPTTTSPTLRGKFVRSVLLCEEVPPPPVNLNTGLPDPTPTAATLRQRLLAHQSQPLCASCHKPMDGIGLGLEQFDGLGVLRSQDSGQPIDASGSLDDRSFADAGELAQVVHDHPNLGPCFARRLFRYAAGHKEHSGEEAFIQSLADRQVSDGYRVQALLRAIAESDAFARTALAGSN